MGKALLVQPDGPIYESVWGRAHQAEGIVHLPLCSETETSSTWSKEIKKTILTRAKGEGREEGEEAKRRPEARSHRKALLLCDNKSLEGTALEESVILYLRSVILIAMKVDHKGERREEKK